MQVAGRGKIVFEDNVSIGVFPSPAFLDSYAYLEARNETASITIGGGTWINNGFSCIADHTAIVIGRNCLIGANVEVLDSDFHGIGIRDRSRSKHEWAAPVYIGDNVFLGSNVRVLKGARIGSGSVIANSSVVTGNVPENVIAAGVPARVIRELSP
ncbi:acyltransferase [Luteimonas sp. A537]